MIKGIYQFKNFSAYRTILQGVSSKAFGSMKNIDTLEIDRVALRKFAKNLGIMGDIVCMKQIHSGTVAVVSDTKNLRILDTDGVITNKKNIPLAVLTADCLPILFYDPKKEAIGMAHAGYRGLLNHIVENTISRFVSEFKSEPKDIIVGIGPGIERMCYEVGEEVILKFQKTFPSFVDISTKIDEKYFLDLREVAQQCLIQEGILKEHISVMEVCTKCDPNCYSYRGGDGDNRFASIISLV